MRLSTTWTAVLLLCLSYTSCGYFREESPRPKTVIELDSGWRFRSAEAAGRWLPATVPGTVHTDLFAAGEIPDPFFGNNEKALQWIEYNEWIYECSFTVDKSFLEHDMILLEFEGLDTYAVVTLNGDTVISAHNMFRPREEEVKPFLRIGENDLVVRFLPPAR